jgi:hypothetical protein
MNESWYTGPHRPLSDYDRDAILFMAENKRPLADIAGAVGRCLGTVKSEVFRLRRGGVLPASGRCRVSV